MGNRAFIQLDLNIFRNLHDERMVFNIGDNAVEAATGNDSVASF